MLKKIGFGLLRYLLVKVLWPYGEELVKSTDNPYDDAALDSAKGLVYDLLQLAEERA